MAVTTNLRNTTANSESLAGANTVTKRIAFADNTMVVTDILQLFDVEYGQRIMIKLNVITGQGAVCTADLITTESSPITIMTAADLSTAGVINAPVTIWTLSEDAIITLVAGHTIDAAVIDVSVTMLDL